MNNITLIPLKNEDREQFIHDNQEAFNYGAHPMTIIALVMMLVVEIWASITYAYRTSKVFGHGLGYTIGLIFLPNIFWLILGFGKSKYNKKNLKK